MLLRPMEKRLRVEVKRLQRQIDASGTASTDALARRLDRLERLLTEHPQAPALTAAARPLGSPAVSIVTPTWNRAAIVGAAIRSVQAQSFADWEMIVVDDGSTDDTASVVASFAADPRIRFAPISHGGQCRARNHALTLARGGVVAYLDSDNVWYPDFLAAAAALFEARPAIDCAYGAMITEAHGLQHGRILFEAFDRARLVAGNFIGMSTFVHRRDLVARFGGFDETLDGLEDWDLILRYTSHAPAYALPVLAVRYWTVDEKRVSATRPLHAADARIRAKWSA
jgi:glycosyltransferase involved in cell wall biosynthesis